MWGVTFQLTHVKCESSTMERQAAALVNGKVFLLVESERKKKNDEICVENFEYLRVHGARSAPRTSLATKNKR